jgi:hypothetical protein
MDPILCPLSVLKRARVRSEVTEPHQVTLRTDRHSRSAVSKVFDGGEERVRCDVPQF